jgi:hypothetical protein
MVLVGAGCKIIVDVAMMLVMVLAGPVMSPLYTYVEVDANTGNAKREVKWSDDERRASNRACWRAIVASCTPLCNGGVVGSPLLRGRFFPHGIDTP